MICSTKQNIGSSTSTSSSVRIHDEIDPILDVSISILDSLIFENKFAPLEVEDSWHISDFSPDVHRLFHDVSSTERIREESLQLITLEENTDLPLPIEETTEIESVTELEPAASMLNPFPLSKEVVAALLEYDLCIWAVTRKGKPQRKVGPPRTTRSSLEKLKLC